MPERSRRDPLFLITRSESMRSVVDEVRRLAESPVPVLIEGESGVGKELIARALHEWGPRAGRRFVVGNCAAIPDALAEAELFGHVAGAFTGALRDRRGIFEAADGGTVFLDELGEMTAGVQAKLLRVLENGEYRRLGENDARRASVRVIAATNRDLERSVVDGRFREDLYYRVAVVRVRVPPLRERREEIPELARQLLAGASARAGRRGPRLADDALAALCSYRWPGNIRELRNEMERVVALHAGGEAVGRAALSERVRSNGAPGGLGGERLSPMPYGSASVGRGEASGGERSEARTASAPCDGRLRERLVGIERSLLCEALERYGWNKSRTARELGMTRQGLAKKMTRFRIPARPDATAACIPMELGADEPGSADAARSAIGETA